MGNTQYNIVLVLNFLIADGQETAAGKHGLVSRTAPS